MHDTDATPPSLQPGTLREEAAVASLPRQAGEEARKTSNARHEVKKAGLVQRVMKFFARFFKRKHERHIPELTVTDRAAVARAAQLPPPMAFKGDTANTLATPMGAYAGKPVEQAMRKRAEQQLKSMDIARTTMH